VAVFLNHRVLVLEKEEFIRPRSDIAWEPQV
jgi:hypothetical protein